ncbi:MAG: DUF2125 domain-containing protein [Pseudomonadota bacterium]
MSRYSPISLATSALILFAPSALAEITADDVWADWQTYLKSFGYSVQGQEQRAGDQLIITGVKMDMVTDDVAGGSITMDRIVMTEQSDGSVSINLPAITPMTFTSLDAQGRTARMSMDYRHTDLEILASGSPDALRYTYAAEDFTFETTGVEINGEVMPPELTNIDVTLQNLSGTSTSTRGGTYAYAQDLAVASLRYAISAVDPGTQDIFNVSGQMQDLGFQGQSEMPLDAGTPGNMNDMLENGLTTEGTFDFAASASTVDVSSAGETLAAALISGPGSLDVSLAENRLQYDVRQSQTQMEVSGTEVPFPMSVEIKDTAFNLLMPLRQSDTPEDFAFGLTFDGFSMSEALWGLFDPTAQLPRDPATIALDLAGKARLLFDFLDPTETMDLPTGQAPAEIENVDIRQLLVTALGAKLTGTGAFTFENPEVGPPEPQGAIDLTLTGANALIDRLIATGLLPQEQAMGARMMMGLLAVPGDAPDTLNSRIEINAEGHVLANGQRIQ